MPYNSILPPQPQHRVLVVDEEGYRYADTGQRVPQHSWPGTRRGYPTDNPYEWSPVPHPSRNPAAARRGENGERATAEDTNPYRPPQVARPRARQPDVRTHLAQTAIGQAQLAVTHWLAAAYLWVRGWLG